MTSLFAHGRAIRFLSALALSSLGCSEPSSSNSAALAADPAGGIAVDEVQQQATRMVNEGRRTFRFDTFGDEAFWGGTIKLHEAINGSALGGVGGGLDPTTALSLGLKVDVDKLPASLVASLKAGNVDLTSPATTIALLQLDAVVGVKGIFAGNDKTRLASVGVQCALCHSTVDDSFAPGIGRRLDGWPNQDLNVGGIVSLAPDLSIFTKLLGVDVPTVKKVLASWGPGKYDAELLLDGKAFRPDGKSGATLIPPALRLAGVNLHTWTGWGSVPYWNAFVATTQMHGVGTFYDPRLDDAAKFPIAAANGFGHVVPPAASTSKSRTSSVFGEEEARNDHVTSKLASLQVYQLTIPIPAPPAGSFDAAAAARGKAVFEGQARCGTCHTAPLYTEPGWNMHTADEIGIDDFQASRSPDDRYRTAPLRALFTHAKRGYYHDGRFATLDDVVAHYDRFMKLGLTATQRADLVEFLKSL